MLNSYFEKKLKILKEKGVSNLERKVKVSGLSAEERFGKHTSFSCSQSTVTHRQGFPSVMGKAWPPQNAEHQETKPTHLTYISAPLKAHHNQHASASAFVLTHQPLS